MLSGEKNAGTYAKIINLATFYKPENDVEVKTRISDFLASESLKTSDIDLVLLGKNGDVSQDRVFDQLAADAFDACQVAPFKHLCGEYQTSNAFAMWLAAKILKEGVIPSVVLKSDSTPRRILIYNQYLGSHHSLILLESC